MWRFWLHRWLSIALLLWQLHECTANFTFAYSEATQCDDFVVSWQGGTGPFQLTLVPEAGAVKIFDIPDSFFSNNAGTYNTTMAIQEANRVLAVMSDSNGFASGGVSPVITVGQQIGEKACTFEYLGVAFSSRGLLSAAQCIPYEFFDYPDAVQPITIKGVVPGGKSFILNPPNGAQTFEWITDIAAGTVVAMYIEDADGRQGQVTGFMRVLKSPTGDDQCLDSSSPSSVANAPSMTFTSNPSTSHPTNSGLPTTSTTAPSVGHRTSRKNVAAIAGGVVGGVVVLPLLGLLAWLCSRRRGRITAFGGRILGRQPAKEKIDLAQDDAKHPPHAVINQLEYVLHNDTPDPSAADSNSHMQNRPPADDGPSTFAPASAVRQPSSSSGANATLWLEASPPPSTSARRPGPRGASSTLSISTDASGAPSGHSSASRDLSVKSGGASGKAAQPDAPQSPQRLTRVVLHTDLADVPPPPIEEEIIELPPQYTERAPLPASIAQAEAGVSRPPSSDSGRSAHRLSTAEPQR